VILVDDRAAVAGSRKICSFNVERKLKWAGMKNMSFDLAYKKSMGHTDGVCFMTLDWAVASLRWPVRGSHVSITTVTSHIGMRLPKARCVSLCYDRTGCVSVLRRMVRQGA
jgi:hypothetical protein